MQYAVFPKRTFPDCSFPYRSWPGWIPAAIGIMRASIEILQPAIEFVIRQPAVAFQFKKPEPEFLIMQPKTKFNLRKSDQEIDIEG